MKVLILGAGGQLGTALQPALKGHTVVACTHKHVDITDARSVMKAMHAARPDLVINAAAYNFVDKAESDPAPAFAVNDIGPRTLAEATSEMNVPFVHVSTDYVFDGKKGKPYTEEDAVAPVNAYGRSKEAGEVSVRRTNPKHFIVRTAWVYHDTGRNFFRLMHGLSEKGPVKVVNDQFSSPTYAPDLADGILKLVASGVYGTYHLAGSGGGTSRYEQLLEFYKRIGHEGTVTPVSMATFQQPAPRPAYTVLESIRKPRIVLPDWRDGVARFADAFVKGGRV